MPVVIFFARLDLEQKSSFLDGHYLGGMMFFYKMKTVFFVLLALLLHGIVYAQGHNHHALWQVTSGNNTVYLLGSIHLLKNNSVLIKNPMDSAFENSQVLVFEADLKDMANPDFQQMMLKKGMLSKGDSLKNKIKKETYESARVKAAELGLDIELFSRFKPWFFIMTLSVAKLQALGFDSQNGLDIYFYKKAVQKEKRILGLETLEQQMAMLDIMSKVDQDDLVCQSLEELDVLEKEMSDIVNAWSNGDMKKLERTILKSFNDFPDIYNALIFNRNKDWGKKIDLFLKQKENYMIVVGAAHLAGKNGLVELLKKKGYSIHQM